MPRDDYEALLERVTGGDWQRRPRGWALGPGYGLMGQRATADGGDSPVERKASPVATPATSAAPPPPATPTTSGRGSSAGTQPTTTSTAAPAGFTDLAQKATTNPVWQAPTAQPGAGLTAPVVPVVDVGSLFGVAAGAPDDGGGFGDDYHEPAPSYAPAMPRPTAPPPPKAGPAGLTLLAGLAYFLFR